jgi:transposase-like protein
MGPIVSFQELIGKSTDADWLREMIGFAARQPMDLEVEGRCGAGFGERSEDRVDQRSGYRDRRWRTRAGAVDRRSPSSGKAPACRPFSNHGA